MDLETLLEPVAADEPAGPDLSYDAGRQAIEQAFESGAENVDWDRTIAMIEAQARQTRDVWLAVYLMRAGAKGRSLTVVEEGALLLAGLFENFWDSAHPSLTEYGIEGRKGACEALVRIGEFLAPLRAIPLVVHPRLGSFSGGDFQRFAEEGAMASGYGDFRAAIAEMPVEQLAAIIERLGAIAAAIERADAVLSTQADTVGHTGTNFRPTYEALDLIVQAIAPYAILPVAEGEEVAESMAPPESLGGSPAPQPGRINNRDDVARAIDAIIAYYDQAEPSSPIPVALSRVKSWITMDFMTILNDIAPGSRSEAMTVLEGRNSDQNHSSDMM